MNKTQVKRVRTWIKNLRSGEYPQTVGALEDSQGFCCLGVACVQAEAAGVIQSRPSAKYTSFGVEGDWTTTELPFVAAKWFGFDTVEGPSFRAKGYGNKITNGIDMNDDRRPFTEVADALEKWLDKQIVSA